MKWTGNPVLNEMMSGMNRRPYGHHNTACNYNRPAANIIENDKDFSIELAVPGMKKDDFKVNLENDILTISVEKEEMNEKEDKNFTRREFRFDSFSRSFSLPEVVDQEKIKADYKNGVLSLVLPKSEEAKIKGRDIKIS